MDLMKPEKKEEKKKKSKKLVAKKDFVIHHNDFHLDIKEGDELKDLPEKFVENLKTEKVI